ncbi:hypothetical protein [Stappia indica]|uniref:hypothetical protein n=1 Tax=Stappia indica TaxID=538381 RepID=UPI00082F83E5|nr:hypothetical protein [Stappia indica]
MDGTDEGRAGLPARLRKAAGHLALLALLAAASPAAADHLTPGDRLGANINEIANTLMEYGYVTLRYMNKGGQVEIVARKGKDEVFLLIDAATGVLETAIHKDGDPLLERPPVAAPPAATPSTPPESDEESSTSPGTRDPHGDRLSARVVAGLSA